MTGTPKGTGRAAAAKILRSKQFDQRAALLPEGWTVESISQSDDRAMVAYARAVTGLDITNADGAVAAFNTHGNALTRETMRWRARIWWRDFGRRVHEGVA